MQAVERVSSEFEQAHSLEEVKSEARRLHENAEKDLQTEVYISLSRQGFIQRGAPGISPPPPPPLEFCRLVIYYVGK